MATIADVKTLLDLYGVGVRAGTITPQKDDEAYFRSLIDLPDMSAETSAAWDKEGGYRRPITLASADGSAPALNQALSGSEDAG